jgi:hypothetical protein
MRNVRAGALAALVSLAAAAASAASMTAMERRRLISHFEMTESWLASELAGLSRAQLEFRPAPGVWSILENLDHLVVCEPIYWRNFQDAMKAPPRLSQRSDSDDSVLWYGIDRTNRAPVVAGEDASGKLKDAAAGLAAFRKLRAEMLQYARTTGDDLRAHYVPRENSDAYQWLLLISTHAQRHILQIREVKASAGYPAK